MRNRFFARLGLALALAAPAPGLAQHPDGHSHTGLSDGRTLLHGDKLWFRGAHAVAAHEVIEGDVVVASGSLTVRGEVHGDAVVGGGDLVLEPGSLIYGDAVVTGGKLINRGGGVLGKVQEGSPRGKAAATQAMHLRRGWMGSLGDAFGGMVRTLALGLVLACVGLGLAFYGMPYLNRVSDVVRRTPLNAAGIGLAANVLALPAFIAGLAALTLTIVGIPLLLVFIPLFWTVLIALAGIGIIAVAHVVGRRTAESRGELGDMGSNAYTHLLTGLAVLLAPLFISHLLGLTPFVGWVGGVLEFASWALLWVAASLGAGAVLIVAVSLWNERGYRGDSRLGGMDDLGTGGARAA